MTDEYSKAKFHQFPMRKGNGIDEDLYQRIVAILTCDDPTSKLLDLSNVSDKSACVDNYNKDELYLYEHFGGSSCYKTFLIVLIIACIIFLVIYR